MRKSADCACSRPPWMVAYCYFLCRLYRAHTTPYSSTTSTSTRRRAVQAVCRLSKVGERAWCVHKLRIHATVPNIMWGVICILQVGNTAAARATSSTAGSTLSASQTAHLDQLTFGEPSVVRHTDHYGSVSMTVASLNSKLWSSANITSAEVPFSVAYSSHSMPGSPGGGSVMESVLNFSAVPSCTTTVKVLPISPNTAGGGTATLPTSASSACTLGTAHGLDYDQCVSHCCSQMNCSAFAWYYTAENGATQGLLCTTFTKDFSLGPQDFGPAKPVRAAKGGVLTVRPASNDHIVNGLRSGTWLGGVGTGGYEIRADGTFHLSTIRNQSPASEPWQATMRDMVLAVSVDGESRVIRLQPFGNLSGVPQIIYNDAFPVARLKGFLGNLTLFAYSLIRPGDSNVSNTPAIVYTLRTTNQKPDGAPLKLSFIVAGAAFRNDWRQVSTPLPQPNNTYSSRAECAAACTTTPSCRAWEFAIDTKSCYFDSSTYAQGANHVGVDSGFPGSFVYTPVGVSFNTRTIEELPSAPPPHDTCQTAPQVPGVTITGKAATRTVVADGQTGLAECRASCCKQTACTGWVVANKTAPNSAKAAPCVSEKACCWMMTGLVKRSAPGTTWATSSVIPRGIPPTRNQQLHNGLGSEGFFVPAGQDANHLVGSGSASSVEALLSTFDEPEPTLALAELRKNTAGDLFQATALTASVAQGQSVSLSVAHTWYFPTYTWYRDTHSGSDNGVRYSLNFESAESVAASINLELTTQSLHNWHSIYDGLNVQSPLLRDAALNLFNHVRSASWHRNDGRQYRQWESYEFADYMNPTSTHSNCHSIHRANLQLFGCCLSPTFH
eukprot:COSAG02_NODE_2026_length_10083_cov_4.210737_4_plen_839_part_00